MFMLAQLFMQILCLAIRDERMFSWIIVAKYNKEQKPNNADRTKEIEDHRPLVITNYQS